MAVIEELEENLTRLIYSEKYIAIKYFTNDCESCNTLAPIFEEFSKSKKYENVIFVKIQADNNPIAQQYIKTTKTSIMVSYKDGLLINSSTIPTKEDMKKFLDELINNKS